MSTSGIANFNPTIVEVLEEAYERAGVPFNSGYDYKSGLRTFNYVLTDLSNRGINLWEVEQKVLALTAGVASYTLDADTIDVLDVSVRTGTAQTQVDVTITRTSFVTFNQISTKNTPGYPIQWVVFRNQAAPVITLWPVPDASQPYSLVYYRLRRTQNAGNAANTMDVPFRFIEALTAGVAFRIAVKKAPQRMGDLKALYDEAWQMAADEDRQRSSWRLIPGGYEGS